jgi:hypothetical protein
MGFKPFERGISVSANNGKKIRRDVRAEDRQKFFIKNRINVCVYI